MLYYPAMAEEQGTESNELPIEPRPVGVSGEVQLLEQDFLDAAASMRGFRRTRRFGYAGLLVASGALLTVGVCEHDAQHADPVILSQLVGATVVSLIFVVGAWWQKKSWARRSARESRASRFLFDEAGYATRSSQGEGRIAWAGFIGHLEIPTAFLLYPRSSIVFIVPKRLFQPDEIEWLRATLCARVPAPPKPAR